MNQEMTYMLPGRLTRYRAFMADEYINGLLKAHEFSLAEVNETLWDWSRGGIRQIVFTGMGCSAIVSDLIRGYLLAVGAPLDIHVVNDYAFEQVISPSVLADPGTLVIVSSYSGHSAEPMRALDRLSGISDRVIALTSGGPLAELAREQGASLALWQLSNADREYPLFHVTQYFVILLELLEQLGAIGSEHRVDAAALAEHLVARRPRTAALGDELARAARDAAIYMVAAPIWHDSLLKLCKMHLNEIAMVQAGRTYFHEFCHSEVATFSAPAAKQAAVFFADPAEDAYTADKRERVVGLLNGGEAQSAGSAVELPMEGTTFCEKLFTTLDVVQHMTLALVEHRPVRSRDLISEAAGNPWYHSETIAAELGAAVAAT
jgi:glucose/mannose-6-phosphate isomerase